MAIRILTDPEYEYLAQLQYDNNRALSTSYLSQYLTRPDVASALSRNQQAYPHLTPGAALALAKSGQGPDSPLTQQVAQATAERRVKKGGGWGVIGDFLTSATTFIGKGLGMVTAVQPFDVKAATRIPLAGLNTLSEGVDVLTAHTAHNIKEKGLVGGLLSGALSGSSSIPAIAQQGRQLATTTAGIALEPDFNLGSGFFPGGSARDEQAKRARSIYEVDGHAATLGRIVARNVFEPGTRPYNFLSGTVDTLAELGLDPTIAPLRALGATRQAAKLLDPATPSSQTFVQSATSALLSPLPRVSRADIGLLETPTRWTVDDNAARVWLTSTKSGQAFLKDVSAHTTSKTASYTNYFRTRYNLPLHVSRELSDAATEPEVIDTFSRHFLSGVLREKPHARINPDIRPSSRFRLAGSFPREQYALRDDLDQAASQLEAHLHNAGIRGAPVDYYIDRLARLPDQMDFANANDAFDQIFKDAFEDIANRVAGQVDATGTVTGKGSIRVGEKVYLPDRIDRGEVVSAPYAKTVASTERIPGVSTPAPISGDELYVKVRVADRAAPIEVPVTELSVHLPQTRIRNMVKVVSDDLATVHDDITDELATDSPRLGVMVDGALDDLDPAHATAEFLNGAITLPSVREIRQLSSTYGRFLNDSSLSFVPNMFDAFYRVWRPVKILTVASMVRNIGEGQVRMAAAGIRPPAHPLQIIGNIIGRGKKALSDDGSLQDDFLTSSQELGRLLGHTSRAWLDNQYRNAQQLLRPYDPSFSSSWADEIGNMHSDLTFRRLAGYWDDVDDFTPTGHHLKDTQEWFWTRQVPELKKEIAEKNWPGYLRSRSHSDKFIAQAQFHLEHLTRGDTRLLEAVARGTFTDHDILLEEVLPAAERAARNLPPLYHGTSTEIKQLDLFGGNSSSNLFGPGFYGTADEDVAKTYRHKGRGRTPTVYSLSAGDKELRVLDMDQLLPSNLKPKLQRWLEGISQSSLLDDVSEEAFERVKSLIESGTGSALYKAIRVMYGEAGLPRYEVDEVLNDLNDAIFRGSGFDVFRYQGGVRTGNKRHEAFVFLDPEGIKLTKREYTKVNPVKTVIEATDNGYKLANSLLAYTRSQTGLPNTPTWVKAPQRLPDSKRKTWDTMVNALFRNLYDIPTEKAVVIPTFRGFYFKRAQELLPRLDRSAQERVLTLARDAGLPRSELRNLAHAMLDKSGDLTFDEFDAVAKSFASKSSRDLLYEFSEKRQFGDAFRFFFPFYDAWRDMISTYGKLIVKNPANIRRFQVAVQGARGNDSDPGTGFFHIDPSTNEEVFSYPFSEHLTRGLTNVLSGGAGSVPIPLTGNVQNLNQFSHTFLPGVGPVIQWPVSRLIPDRPDTDWLHNVVNPVGDPNLSGTVTSPWMSNIIRGFTADINKDRNYANTHADTVRYLMSTGQYDPSSESDMRAMADKATSLAKSTYYLRSLVGWIAPSQPSPDWRAHDASGKLISQYKMSQAFHEMADDPDIGYDNALLAFVTNFGEKNILAITGRSIGTSPDNKATYDWMRENPDLVRDYPDAYNFFAPRSAERSPYEAYTQSFATGNRRLLTEREWYARGNDILGSMLYYSAKELIGPKPAKNQTEWLRNYRSFLRQKYPGFDPGPTDSGRQDRIIEQLYEAANDGILATTTTGKAIQIYLNARDQAIESAARGKIVNWGQAKSTRNIRNWLRSRAAEISARYPEFDRVWDQVFSREMQEDR